MRDALDDVTRQTGDPGEVFVERFVAVEQSMQRKDCLEFRVGHHTPCERSHQLTLELKVNDSASQG